MYPLTYGELRAVHNSTYGKSLRVDPSCLKELLAHGADNNAKSATGTTAFGSQRNLMESARRRREVARYLPSSAV